MIPGISSALRAHRTYSPALSSVRSPTVAVTTGTRSFTRLKKTELFTHAIEGFARGGTVVHATCHDIVDSKKWQQTLDRSRVYNLATGKIGNRAEFTEFVTQNVFTLFAKGLSAKWQGVFKEQLKSISFDDAFELFNRFSAISRQYADLDDKIKDAEAASLEAKDEKSIWDAQERKAALDIDMNRLNSQMSLLQTDCLLVTSIAHAKKLLEMHNPSEQKDVTHELEQAAGRPIKEMETLFQLQSFYMEKAKELGEIDHGLYPKEYEAKQKECRNSLRAILDLVHFTPNNLAKVALRFETEYRQKAGEKLDPKHYVSTEYQMLSNVKSTALSWLLTLLITSTLAWTLLDDLDATLEKEEAERKSFITDATYLQHSIAKEIAQLKSELEHTMDHPAYQQHVQAHLTSLEKLNEELLAAIQEYEKISKNQLNPKNLMHDMAKEKIKDYPGLEKHIKKSHEAVDHQGSKVRDLMRSIKETHHKLTRSNQAFSRLHKAQNLADKCQKNLKHIEENAKKLTPKSRQHIDAFYKDLAKLRDVDFHTISEDRLKQIEALSLHIEMFRTKHHISPMIHVH